MKQISPQDYPPSGAQELHKEWVRFKRFNLALFATLALIMLAVLLASPYFSPVPKNSLDLPSDFPVPFNGSVYMQNKPYVIYKTVIAAY